MIAQHTPGPWMLGADLTGVILNKRDEGGQSDRDNCTKNGWAKTVCKITHAAWTGVEQHVANGRLIAAAPDLLAALKDVLTALEMLHRHHHPDWDGSVTPTSAIGMARAAIRKAEGQS